LRARELGWVVAAGVLCGGGRARAGGVGYQLDHYEPTPAGDPFLVVEAPWYATTRTFAAALTFDYAHDLVIAQHVDDRGDVITDPAPIAHAGTAHLDVAVALTAWVALTASVPLVLDEGGTAFAGVGPRGTSVGDPRLGARAHLLGEPDGALALDASAYLWVPIGVEDHFAGDSSARGLGRVTASGLVDPLHLRWAANASILARKTAVLSPAVAPGGNTVGSEAQLAAAASYGMLDDRLSVGPEAILSIGLTDLPAPQHRAVLEALGTARLLIDDQLAIGVGVGGAIAGGPGPDVRVLLSLAYAPAPARGSRIERVIVLPDDDGHVGAVEVDDGHHKTLLDKAYASTEITRKTGEARPRSGSPDTVPPAAAALARTMPPPDRDGDGVADADDGCPDRAGVVAPDPIRDGCPAASEKVVVLPDDDGHVGAVEIDDGHGTTVLASAYATAEVGADGRAQVVPAAPPKSTDHAIAQVARAMPAPDADGDGILDLDDACPDRAGGASRDPIRNGCPAAAERMIVVPDGDGHVGAIEIDDGHGKTVLDQAYASADVAADGVAQAAPPTTQGRSIDRALASLARAMPIVDSDGDGVPDLRDVCPERAGVASSDPLRDGCPHADEKVVLVPDLDGHVGGVEVDDGSHTIVLDVAYASAEVSGGKAVGVPAATPVALVKATAAIARTLPAPDRDDDGIADGDDACPDRAGAAAPTPARNGCPRTVEQVVVLPDENGTVGAVEVDDGTTTTVLDKAYAAAEIGLDGRTHALPAEASEVSARYAEAMAARPAGARIILYFTAGSAPARDLTGPIDNLVAEVKAKGTYTIEVIGHTDQTGSERMNVKIGQQRAQVIADKLIAAGVPADRITITSKGSSEPAVKRRSRRVVELRNRRVEIWVK
jgi:OmpA-OmpF porin, OOP family